MLRRLHRGLGVALALPLVVWMATGLLFHVKHRYAEAYEQIALPPEEAAWSVDAVAPGELMARGAMDRGPFGVGPHPSGRLAYWGTSGGRPVTIDAGTGGEIAAADDATALAWAAAAVAASPHAARYGSPGAVAAATRRSARTGREHPALAVSFSGGKTVTVDRLTGEMDQQGAVNDWIDLTYRLHYLQWTPWKAVNAGLVLVAIPLVVGLALSGLRMAWAGRS